MTDLIASIISPQNIQSIVIVMLGLFAKDFVVGVLRRLSKRLLTDKDPKNDALGELADQAADSIEKVRIPSAKR
jgi:hypothetical protein